MAINMWPKIMDKNIMAVFAITSNIIAERILGVISNFHLLNISALKTSFQRFWQVWPNTVKAVWKTSKIAKCQERKPFQIFLFSLWLEAI